MKFWNTHYGEIKHYGILEHSLEKVNIMASWNTHYGEGKHYEVCL